MFCNRNYTFAWVVVLTTILALGANVHAQERARLSLDPYAVLTDGGGSLIRSGYDAPTRLPANNSTSSFTQGFTIPNDYQSNAALRVIILWESPSTQCNFVLNSSFLFRARAGHPRDFGGASDGLEPVSASTPFTTLAQGRSNITMAAPNTAHQTERVRFDITASGFAPDSSKRRRG